ncbi:MAG: hypothetical protein HY703_02255 [Gemmatimonadetes bacterium]|nr:hypothetical protein [Gemmatimonadota bacterium]
MEKPAEPSQPQPEELGRGKTAPPARRATPAGAGAAPICDVCGSPMYELHCRIICAHCGYERDCTDP